MGIFGKKKEKTNAEHSNTIFRMNGFTALLNAKGKHGWTYEEIANLLELKIEDVTDCFYLGYQRKPWQLIIKIAETLGVNKEQYVKQEYVNKLPKEVAEFLSNYVGVRANKRIKGGKKPLPQKKVEQVEKLLKEEKYMSIQEIADTAGVSKTSVNRIKERLGMTVKHRSKITPEKYSRVVKLLKKGVLKGNTIARMLNISPASVSEIRHKEGMTDARYKANQSKDMLIEEHEIETVSLSPEPNPNIKTVADVRSANQWAVDVIKRMDVITVMTIHTDTQEIIIKRKASSK